MEGNKNAIEDCKYICVCVCVYLCMCRLSYEPNFVSGYSAFQSAIVLYIMNRVLTHDLLSGHWI